MFERLDAIIIYVESLLPSLMLEADISPANLSPRPRVTMLLYPAPLFKAVSVLFCSTVSYPWGPLSIMLYLASDVWVWE